jgi:hypothetical protein
VKLAVYVSIMKQNQYESVEAYLHASEDYALVLIRCFVRGWLPSACLVATSSESNVMTIPGPGTK